MTVMFRPMRSLSYAPDLNTATSVGVARHAYTVRDVHLIWLPMDGDGTLSERIGVRQTHRTLRVHIEHTDARHHTAHVVGSLRAVRHL